MTLANRLTLLRVALAVAVFAALMAESAAWHAAALALFLAAVVTDWLDGWLARSTGTISPFGKVADPIADKVLVLGTLLSLVRVKDFDVPLWALFAILMREMLILGVRVIAGAQGKVLAADRWGKLKTGVQLAAVALMILVLVLRDRGLASAWMIDAVPYLVILCAFLALSTLVTYFRQYRVILEKSWS